MQEYMELVTRILDDGETAKYRNGDRRSVFGESLVFDLADGFPLVTIKKTHYKAAFDEMLWMLSGKTNIKYLRYPKTWEQWALKQSDIDKTTMAYPMGSVGSIGPIYGSEYRYATNNSVPVKRAYFDDPKSGVAPDVLARLKKSHGDWYDTHERAVLLEHLDTYIDQVWELIQGIKNNPHSTRHRIQVYSPESKPDESLTPQENIMRGKGSLTACNISQIYTVSKGKLSLHITQASSDVLIGLPYNIAQFALLLELIARETDLIPGKLHMTLIDAHIYADQLTALDESGLLFNEPKALPSLVIEDSFDIWYPNQDKLHMSGYISHPFVKIPVST